MRSEHGLWITDFSTSLKIAGMLVPHCPSHRLLLRVTRLVCRDNIRMLPTTAHPHQCPSTQSGRIGPNPSDKRSKPPNSSDAGPSSLISLYLAIICVVRLGPSARLTISKEIAKLTLLFGDKPPICSSFAPHDQIHPVVCC